MFILLCKIMTLSTPHRRHSLCFEKKGVNWRRMLSKSIDLNPIENVWHELKEFLRREIKAMHLGGAGGRVWDSVTPVKCMQYNLHFRKLIPRVVLEW